MGYVAKGLQAAIFRFKLLLYRTAADYESDLCEAEASVPCVQRRHALAELTANAARLCT